MPNVRLSRKVVENPVANLSALSAIDTTLFNDGVFAYVKNIDQFFTLDKSSTETIDSETVVAANPSGRWITQRSRIFNVASEVAQLALISRCGDIANRTDINEAYVHNGGTEGSMADWTVLPGGNAPTPPTQNIIFISGATHTVTSADDNAILIFTHASGCAVTLPQTSTEELAEGFNFYFLVTPENAQVTFQTQGSDTFTDRNVFFYEQSAWIVKTSEGTPNAWSALLTNNQEPLRGVTVNATATGPVTTTNPQSKIYVIKITSGTKSFKLAAANTNKSILLGDQIIFHNNSDEDVQILYQDNTELRRIPANSFVTLTLLSNSTANGTWHDVLTSTYQSILEATSPGPIGLGAVVTVINTNGVIPEVEPITEPTTQIPFGICCITVADTDQVAPYLKTGVLNIGLLESGYAAGSKLYVQEGGYLDIYDTGSYAGFIIEEVSPSNYNIYVDFSAASVSSNFLSVFDVSVDTYLFAAEDAKKIVFFTNASGATAGFDSATCPLGWRTQFVVLCNSSSNVVFSAVTPGDEVFGNLTFYRGQSGYITRVSETQYVIESQNSYLSEEITSTSFTIDLPPKSFYYYSGSGNAVVDIPALSSYVANNNPFLVGKTFRIANLGSGTLSVTNQSGSTVAQRMPPNMHAAITILDSSGTLNIQLQNDELHEYTKGVNASGGSLAKGFVLTPSGYHPSLGPLLEKVSDPSTDFPVGVTTESSWPNFSGSVGLLRYGPMEVDLGVGAISTGTRIYVNSSGALTTTSTNMLAGVVMSNTSGTNYQVFFNLVPWPSVNLTPYMLKAQNLEDVASVPFAVYNLGLNNISNIPQQFSSLTNSTDYNYILKWDGPDCLIYAITGITRSGTATVVFKINGINVNVSTCNLSSTIARYLPTNAHLVTGGDQITFTCTAASSPVDVALDLSFIPYTP